MRTFQHRIVVTLKAAGVDNEARANVLAGEHIAFWNRTHTNEKVLRLFLSRHVPRKVELGCRIDFMGRKWRIAKTLKKTVWIAIRPENRGFYVLEERPDPTNPVMPLRLERVSNFACPNLSNFARSKSLTLDFGQQISNFPLAFRTALVLSFSHLKVWLFAGAKAMLEGWNFSVQKTGKVQ